MSQGAFDWTPPWLWFLPTGTVKSWTPPLSASNRLALADNSALWDESEALRKEAAVEKKDTSRTHKYKPPSLEQKLEAWSPDVVITLAVGEVLSNLKFVPGASDSAPADLNAVAADGAQHLVCKLTPPADVKFIEGDQRGLKSVTDSSKKGNRKACRNAILAHAASLDVLYMEALGLDVERNRNTYLLLMTVLSVVHATGQQFKHQFSVPRPNLLSQEVQPMLQVPGHASYPAGHSAQAHAASTLIADLLKEGPDDNKNLRNRLRRVAKRVGDMREVAGLHYEFDSIAGQALGLSLASLVKGLSDRSATLKGSWTPHSYGATDSAPTEQAPVTQPMAATPVLSQLWAAAAAELDEANIK